MTRRGALCAIGLVAGIFVAAAEARAALTLYPRITGLTKPVAVVAPPDGSEDLYVVEQGGTVQRWREGAATLFLEVAGEVGCASPTSCGERGLLNLAFHPGWANNGRFFIYWTRAADGAVQIVEYRRCEAGDAGCTPGLANPATKHVRLTIAHPRGNHNGGSLLFGPEGSLYAGTGDGGDGGDPDENGQNPATLLGKILRLDVDRDDFPGDPTRDYGIPAGNPFVGIPGADEVWAYGLRNPWRMSFDRGPGTGAGDLWIGDVGQGSWEEVDHQAASSPGGENYGWDCREGLHAYPDTNGDSNATCTGSGYTDPVAEYDHSVGCSITGGYRYRGSLPSLADRYVYGDYCSGRIWALPVAGGAAVQMTDEAFNITSFGEDRVGELLVVDPGGAAGMGRVLSTIDLVFRDGFERGTAGAAWDAAAP